MLAPRHYIDVIRVHCSVALNFEHRHGGRFGEQVCELTRLHRVQVLDEYRQWFVRVLHRAGRLGVASVEPI